MLSIDLIRENLKRSEDIVLSRIGENDLDKVSENIPNAKDAQGVELLFGTYRRCFQYAADHWFMHRGQLADARCAAGVERMWY